MTLQDDWNKTSADARKILGNNANIPKGKMSVALKAMQDYGAIVPTLTAARDALEKKILDAQNAASKVQNALREAGNEVTDDDYNLDARKPDDKKKIDQASAIFDKFFNAWSKTIVDYVKMLDELDKHLAHVDKFKAAKT